MSTPGAMEAELWDRYIRDRDTDAWHRLATLYGTWSASVARSVHRRVWAYPVDLDDFVQDAQVGLLEAMSRYDPDRGVAFQAIAKPRIRGDRKSVVYGKSVSVRVTLGGIR